MARMKKPRKGAGIRKYAVPVSTLMLLADLAKVDAEFETAAKALEEAEKEPELDPETCTEAELCEAIAKLEENDEK